MQSLECRHGPRNTAVNSEPDYVIAQSGVITQECLRTPDAEPVRLGPPEEAVQDHICSARNIMMGANIFSPGSSVPVLANNNQVRLICPAGYHSSGKSEMN